MANNKKVEGTTANNKMALVMWELRKIRGPIRTSNRKALIIRTPTTKDPKIMETATQPAADMQAEAFPCFGDQVKKAGILHQRC